MGEGWEGVVAGCVRRPADGRRRLPRKVLTQPATTPSPAPSPSRGRGEGRGINAVPAMVAEGKSLISGGQPASVYEEALRKIAGEL